MNDAQIARARALVAHPKWRWLSGMLAVAYLPGGVYRDENGRMQWRIAAPGDTQIGFLPSNLADLEEDGLVYLPDLPDRATGGVLLGALEDTVAGDVRVHSGRYTDSNARHYVVSIGGFRQPHYFDTLGEACADALLDKWGET